MMSTPLLWMNEVLIQSIFNIFVIAYGIQLEASLSQRRAELKWVNTVT